jgi:ribosomal protein S16
MYKIERLKPCGYLGSVPIAKSVFETIFIDLIGPYPPSQSRRNRFCLVVVDQLSNWVELFPMPSAQAKRVAEKLEDEIFCRFGSPKVIVSDNAKHFINKLEKIMSSMRY